MSVCGGVGVIIYVCWCRCDCVCGGVCDCMFVVVEV